MKFRNKENFENFRRAYFQAIKEKREYFQFALQDFNITYAKYLIEYNDTRFKNFK